MGKSFKCEHGDTYDLTLEVHKNIFKNCIFNNVDSTIKEDILVCHMNRTIMEKEKNGNKYKFIKTGNECICYQDIYEKRAAEQNCANWFGVDTNIGIFYEFDCQEVKKH